MKKGFTIIEIIISISLIVIIGITSSILVIKKNKSNIESITKEILEAGSLYLKLELDDNGNNYDKEIYNGAKGVKIPLSNLVSKGYIDESLKQSVIDYAGNLDNDKDYYVMFIENNEYCDENQIVGLSSWMEKGNDIYLCDDYSSSDSDILIDCPIDQIENTDYGKFCYNNELNRYYYVHNVYNNYVKFGKNKEDENDLLWRIIYIDDNKTKLALDYTIKVEKENEQWMINGSLGVNGRTTTGSSCFYKDILNFNFAKVENGKVYFTPKQFIKDSCGTGYYSFSYEPITLDFTWDENKKIEFNFLYKDNHGVSHFVKNSDYTNPLYNWIYEPLYNWYNNTNLDKYNILNSKWCIYGTDNECQNDAYIENKIGLMYTSDLDYSLWGNISSTNYTNSHFFNNEYQLENGNISEVLMKFDSGIGQILFKGAYSTNNSLNKIYLRPTIYVSKALIDYSKEGTIDNPYIIN